MSSRRPSSSASPASSLLRLTMLRPITQGCDTTRSKAARDASARAIVEDWSTEEFVRCASAELQARWRGKFGARRDGADARDGTRYAEDRRLVLKARERATRRSRSCASRLASRARWRNRFRSNWTLASLLNLCARWSSSCSKKTKSWSGNGDVSSILRRDAVVDAVEEDAEEQTPPVDAVRFDWFRHQSGRPLRGGGHVAADVGPGRLRLPRKAMITQTMISFRMTWIATTTRRFVRSDPASLTAMRIASLVRLHGDRDASACSDSVVLAICRRDKRTLTSQTQPGGRPIHALPDIISARPHEPRRAPPPRRRSIFPQPLTGVMIRSIEPDDRSLPPCSSRCSTSPVQWSSNTRCRPLRRIAHHGHAELCGIRHESSSRTPSREMSATRRRLRRSKRSPCTAVGHRRTIASHRTRCARAQRPRARCRLTRHVIGDSFCAAQRAAPRRQRSRRATRLRTTLDGSTRRTP